MNEAITVTHTVKTLDFRSVHVRVAATFACLTKGIAGGLLADMQVLAMARPGSSHESVLRWWVQSLHERLNEEAEAGCMVALRSVVLTVSDSGSVYEWKAGDR